MPILRHLYIVESENSLVKVGFTAMPEKRLKEIRRSIGTPIVRQHISPPCTNARELERLIHRQFALQRREGEWFKIAFESVVDFLEKQALRTGQRNELLPFDFKGHTLRTFVNDKGDPWFCLKDTCDILDIGNPSKVLERLKKAGVTCSEVSYPSGRKRLTFIDETNFYRVIFQSRKAEAEVFQDWVFEEVLPTIRKTGQYTLKTTAPVRKPEYTDFEEFVRDCFIPEPSNITKARDIYLVYQDWCQRRQRPAYKPQWLGAQLGKAGYRRKKSFRGISCWCGFRLSSPICSSDTTAPNLPSVVHDLQNYLAALCKLLVTAHTELLSLVEVAYHKARDIDLFLVN